MTKLVGTAPNQTPTNADLGKLAYQDSIVTAAGGAMDLISRTVISNGDSSVIFTGFDANTYESYEIYFANVVPQNDGRSFYFFTSSDGGLNYDQGNSDYAHVVLKETSATALTLTTFNDFAAGAIYLSTGTGAVATAEVAQGVSGKMEIFGAGDSQKFTSVNYTTSFAGTDDPSVNNVVFWQGIGHRKEAAVVTGIKFEFSTFESGTISFYGIKKS